MSHMENNLKINYWQVLQAALFRRRMEYLYIRCIYHVVTNDATLEIFIQV
jgi:hypothetical protein